MTACLHARRIDSLTIDVDGACLTNEPHHRQANADQDRFGTRKELMDKWMSAKDAKGKDAAWSAVKDYNRDLPNDAKITMKDLQSALKRRKTEDREGGFDRGMRVNKRNKDLHDQMQRVYGGQ